MEGLAFAELTRAAALEPPAPDVKAPAPKVNGARVATPTPNGEARHNPSPIELLIAKITTNDGERCAELAQLAVKIYGVPLARAAEIVAVSPEYAAARAQHHEAIAARVAASREARQAEDERSELVTTRNRASMRVRRTEITIHRLRDQKERALRMKAKGGFDAMDREIAELTATLERQRAQVVAARAEIEAYDARKMKQP